MSIYFKCLKLLILISLIWALGIFTIKLQLKANNENNFNVTIDDEVEYVLEEKVNKILTNKNYTIYITNKNSYLYEEEYINSFNDLIVDFEVSECVYLITDNKLLKYNYKSVKEISFENTTLNDIFIDNKYIYLCGSKNNDSVFYKLNQNLDILDEIVLGGDKFETFINIYVYNNVYYLVGQKDSISNNSPFKNVGKPDTSKIFMIMYYEDIINEVYFNTTTLSENLIDVIFKDYIYLLLDSKEIFKLDYNFNVIPTKQLEYDFDHIFVDINCDVATYKINNNSLFINNLLVKEFDSSILYFDTTISPIVYCVENSKISKYNLFIYQIIKNEELVLTKDNFDYNTLNNLEIYSPFEKLEKRLLESSILNKQVHGTYNVSYQIRRSNNKSFNLDGKLTIKPYINIINNGIYKIGKTLSFFGKAYLNEVEIFNGHVLSEEGNYKLKLFDNNLNQSTYEFSVIDNYYKDCEIVEYKTDYEIFQNDVVRISLFINNFSSEQIKEIIVNDNIYTNYEVIENEIIIYLYPKNYYDISNYYLDKIILENNEEVLINKNITIKTLKTNPIVTLNQSMDNNNIILDYEISDSDKSIMYLETNIYYNEEKFQTIVNYFNNDENFILNNLPKENLKIEHLLIYHTGKNKKTLKLAEYNIEKLRKENLFELTYLVDSNLNKVTFKLNYKNLKLTNLLINNQNILNNINIPNILNNLSINHLVIIGSFIVFSFSLIILKIKRKRKTKQTD